MDALSPLSLLTVTRTAAKLLKCDICEEAYRFPSQLDQHRVKHQAVRPFVCEFCGVGYKYRKNLTEHKKLKEHFRPDEAEKYAKMKPLRPHKRTFDGGKTNWRCGHCGTDRVVPASNTPGDFHPRNALKNGVKIRVCNRCGIHWKRKGSFPDLNKPIRRPPRKPAKLSAEVTERKAVLEKLARCQKKNFLLGCRCNKQCIVILCTGYVGGTVVVNESTMDDLSSFNQQAKILKIRGSSAQIDARPLSLSLPPLPSTQQHQTPRSYSRLSSHSDTPPPPPPPHCTSSKRPSSAVSKPSFISLDVPPPPPSKLPPLVLRKPSNSSNSDIPPPPTSPRIQVPPRRAGGQFYPPGYSKFVLQTRPYLKTQGLCEYAVCSILDCSLSFLYHKPLNGHSRLFSPKSYTVPVQDLAALDCCGKRCFRDTPLAWLEHHRDIYSTATQTQKSLILQHIIRYGPYHCATALCKLLGCSDHSVTKAKALLRVYKQPGTTLKHGLTGRIHPNKTLQYEHALYRSDVEQSTHDSPQTSKVSKDSVSDSDLDSISDSISDSCDGESVSTGSICFVGRLLDTEQQRTDTQQKPEWRRPEICRKRKVVEIAEQ